MKKIAAVAVAMIMLAMLVPSIARSEQSGEVWLTNFLLLRIRCAAGGCSAEQRADTIQQRANDLLALGRGFRRSPSRNPARMPASTPTRHFS